MIGAVTGLDILQEVAAALLLGFAFVALGRAYLRAWRVWREGSGGERGALLGALAAGALLRWAVAPLWIATVFIGYRLTQQAADLVPASHYGLGASALYHAVFAVLPVDHVVLMWTNSVLGVLLLPAAWAFAARYLGDRVAASAFALLLAFIPLFVRNDNSDANNVPCLLWLFAGLVLWEEYFATGARAALAGAVALFTTALVSRPEMPIVVPFVVGLVSLTQPRAHRWWREPWLYAALLVAAVLVVPHALHVLGAQERLYPDVASNALERLGAVLFEENTLLWPSLFPPAVVAFAGAALFFPPLLDWRQRLALLVGSLGTLAIYSIDTCRANMARVHVPAAVLLTLLAAVGVSRVWRRWPQVWVRALVVVALAVSAVPSVLGHWQPTNEQAEEDFLRGEALPALPAERFILLRAGFDDLEHDPAQGAQTHHHFPDYLVLPPARPGALVTLRDFLAHPRWELPIYFYGGMRCYARFRAPEEPPPRGEDRRASCREVEARFALEPVRERVVVNRGDVWIEYYGDAPTLRLGLYRVRPRQAAP